MGVETGIAKSVPGKNVERSPHKTQIWTQKICLIRGRRMHLKLKGAGNPGKTEGLGPMEGSACPKNFPKSAGTGVTTGEAKNQLLANKENQKTAKEERPCEPYKNGLT